MDIEEINNWIEEPLNARPEEIENRFFHSFENRRENRRLEPITYNELRQINIPEGLTGNQLDGLVEEFGIEILAYYIPFHFHRPDRPWGIYLRRVGIDHVRQRLMEIAGQDGHNFQNLAIPTNVAEHILLLHELRHHAIEVAFTRAELQVDTRDEYQQYIRRKRNHNNTSSDTEAICNTNVANHRSLFKTDWERPPLMPPTPPNVIIRLDWNDYVRQFMIEQPVGYRDFARFTGFSSEQALELLQLNDRDLGLEMAQIIGEFNNHSQLSILRRLPVPIRVV